MRCAIAAAEAAMSVMQDALVPGITEQRPGPTFTPIDRPGRGVDRDQAALVRPQDQPLVPGVLQPGHRRWRPGRLRHRPDRQLRGVRGHLPHVGLWRSFTQSQPTPVSNWPPSRSGPTRSCFSLAPGSRSWPGRPTFPTTTLTPLHGPLSRGGAVRRVSRGVLSGPVGRHWLRRGDGAGDGDVRRELRGAA